MGDFPVSDTLVRAARELLRWSQSTLAENAGVGVASVRRYETGANVQQEIEDKIVAALQAAGVAFLGPRTRTRVREGVALISEGSTLPRQKRRAYAKRNGVPALDSANAKALMTKALEHPEALTEEDARQLAAAAVARRNDLKKR